MAPTSSEREVGPNRGRAVVDRCIAARSAMQKGVVTRVQLLHAGVTASAIRHRISTGWLRPVHRGVYQVGPVAAPRAAEMAAALACGDGAVLSHGTAGRMWEVLPAAVPGAPMEVMVEGRECRRPGIRVRRVRSLPADEVTRLDGIPITTPARTLLDLAGTVDRRTLERAVARAERRGLIARAGMKSLLDRYPRRVGAPDLRTLLGDAARPALTRSEAEERFLELVRKAQLGEPEANHGVDGFEVDFLWPAERVVVEVDGFAFHASRRTFETDRRRDAVLAARGFRVMRVTWRQIMREPEAVLVRLAQMLARTDRA